MTVKEKLQAIEDGRPDGAMRSRLISRVAEEFREFVFRGLCEADAANETGEFLHAVLDALFTPLQRPDNQAQACAMSYAEGWRATATTAKAGTPKSTLAELNQPDKDAILSELGALLHDADRWYSHDQYETKKWPMERLVDVHRAFRQTLPGLMEGNVGPNAGRNWLDDHRVVDLIVAALHFYIRTTGGLNGAELRP